MGNNSCQITISTFNEIPARQPSEQPRLNLYQSPDNSSPFRVYAHYGLQAAFNYD